MEKIDDFKLNMFQGCEISRKFITQSFVNRLKCVDGSWVKFSDTMIEARIDDCKPILKTFEHLTDEDLKHLAFLAFGLSNEYDKKDFKISRDANSAVVDYDDISFIIHRDLSVMCEDINQCDYVVRNSHEIAAYLTQNHFDIFGWINAELAIKKEIEKVEGMCDCGRNKAQEPHICPFKDEIYENTTTLCTCCKDCVRECKDGI